MKFRTAATAFLILTLLLTVSPARSDPLPYHPDRIIIKFKPGVELTEKQNIRKELNAKRLRRFRLINAELWEIKGISVEEAVDLYRNDPRIKYIEPDYIIKLEIPKSDPDINNSFQQQDIDNFTNRDQVFPNDPIFEEQWSLHNIGQDVTWHSPGTIDTDIDAPEAWAVQTDCDVVIGVIDTGVDYNHVDLDDNIWMNPNEGDGDFIGENDGCPGFCGIDDDNDAGLTAESNTTDGIDNDGDGLIDETGIDLLDEDVMAADYNHNGIMLVGIDGIFGTDDDDQEDILLAALDDDENGYADDMMGWDWGYNDNDPWDDRGHGTSVTSVIAAEGNNNEGMVGICWSANIMILKTFFFAGPDSVIALSSSSISALEYSIINGAKLTNNSWGHQGPEFDPALVEMIIVAGENNCLFIAGAGNDGDNVDEEPFYPGAHDLENIINVGGSDRYDTIDSGWGWDSNYGPVGVDLAAPTDWIRCAKPGDEYRDSCEGTSIAAPHVTGAAALLWSHEPDLTNLQVKERILKTVDPLGVYGNWWLTGGRLNVHAMLQPSHINISPESYSLSVEQHSQLEDSLIISNTGSGTLTWWMQEKTGNRLTVYPTEGEIQPGENRAIMLTIQTVDLPQQYYACSITLRTNDPDQNIVQIPIDLLISQSANPIHHFEENELFVFVHEDSLTSVDLRLSNIGSGLLNWSLAEISANTDLNNVNILWDQSHGGFWADAFHEILIDDLEARGASVSETEYSSPGFLTPEILEQYDVLWSPTHSLVFSEDEITAVRNWIEGGGNMLIEAIHMDIYSYNSILEYAGIQYSDINLNTFISEPTVHPITYNLSLPYYWYPTFSHLIVNGIARTLYYSSNGSPVTAVSQYGRGRIFVTANMYLNDQLFSGESNRDIGNRVFDWLVNPFRMEQESGFIESGTTDTITININAKRLEPDIYTASLKFITDEPDTVIVPLTVTVLDADQECTVNGDVSFDNETDVRDIVLIVGNVLGNYHFADVQFCNADMDESGAVDVVDIVLVVEIILTMH